MKRIAYQGMKGSYSYLAAINKYGPKHHYIGISTFEEVFKAVEKKEADQGVIPIENCLVGSIHENYDLLYQFNLPIIDELYGKVDHCLFSVSAMKELPLEEALLKIKKVFSHPKALEQCRQFFMAHPWIEATASLNTAEAAFEVAKLNDPSIGAIASAYAGDIYGLNVLQKSIQDNPQNYTRFVCIAKDSFIDSKRDKCSLLLKLKHQPQALSCVLDEFGQAKLNLTKIESRPIHGKPFEYVFYLDFELNGSSPEKVEEILWRIKIKTEMLKCLGFYTTEFTWKI